MYGNTTSWYRYKENKKMCFHLPYEPWSFVPVLEIFIAIWKYTDLPFVLHFSKETQFLSSFFYLNFIIYSLAVSIFLNLILKNSLTFFHPIKFKPRHQISSNEVCATSKGSDQSAHTRSLIRAFAGLLSIVWLLSYWPNTTNRRLHRPIWVDSYQNATLLEITCHGSFIKMIEFPTYQHCFSVVFL